MSVIKRKINLNCTPDFAFEKLSDVNFVKEINPNSWFDVQTIFKTERLVRYVLNIKNVGSWESERVFIPERRLILTQRRKPMSPFEYMVIIHYFEAHEKSTLFYYNEEFEIDNEHIDNRAKIENDISSKLNRNFSLIENYFNSK